MLRLSFIVLFSLMLTACGYVSPAALDRLDSVSPLDANPADLAIALAMPPGLDVVPGSAQINFDVERSDTKETRAEVFTLMRSDAANLNVFTINKADHARLRDVQALAAQWKKETPDRTFGSISVTVNFCTRDPGPGENAKVTILTRTEADGKFYPLIENAPLSVIQKSGAVGDINLC